jgi:hypothetical protein
MTSTNLCYYSPENTVLYVQNNLLSKENENILMADISSYYNESLAFISYLILTTILLHYYILATILQYLMRHYATSRKIAGSIPDEVIEFFN